MALNDLLTVEAFIWTLVKQAQRELEAALILEECKLLWTWHREPDEDA